MSSSSDISSLLHSITEKGGKLDVSDQGSKAALLADARALVAALEPPIEAVLHVITNEPALLASIIIGVNSGLFHAVTDNGGAPKTVKTLAEKTGAEAAFLERIARHLAADRLLLETGPNEYAPTGATHVLTSAGMEAMVRMMLVCYGPILTNIASFFQENGYKNPSPRSPWQYALNTDQSAFQFALRPENEEMAKGYRAAMTVKDSERKWFTAVPVQEILGNSTDADAVVLVDVGGNVGNDLLAFHKAFPDLPGRLVLQDLPGSIARINKDELKPIEPVGHDFFTPQPISGAKAYYLKMILHDWNDENCRKILENLKPALKAGHSKILINEVVILDRGAGWTETSSDMLMMLVHGAQERSERAWRELIGSVGLRVTNIWPVDGASESLIEVELA